MGHRRKLYKQAHLIPVRGATDQPLFYIAMGAVVIGVQLFLAGFIGELISRNSGDRNRYLIDENFKTNPFHNDTTHSNRIPAPVGTAAGADVLPAAGPCDRPGKLGFRIMVWGYDDPTASSSPIVNSLTLAATALLGATIVLEIITVFRYKKRRLQKRLCTAQIVLLLLTAGVTALYLKSFGEEGFGPVALSVTAAFPLVAAILTLLARRGIVKDDKLVRSLDRIR